MTRHLIYFNLLLFVSTVACFGQHKCQDNKCMVVYLKIKEIPLLKDCSIKQDIFDSTTCLALSFDTVAMTEDSSYKHLSCQVISLDSIDIDSFSICEFSTSYELGTGSMIVFDHTDNCFNEKDRAIINNIQTYKKRDLYIYCKLMYKYGDKIKRFTMPEIRIKLII